MKKIFTVLFAVSSFSFVNAQSHDGNVYDRNDNRDNAIRRNDDRKYDNSYSFTARERDEQIARINSFYNAKISDIRMDRFLRSNKKRKEIANLNVERSQKIMDINSRFSDRRNRFSDAVAYGSNNRRY